jgi:hypothetical protein
LPPALHNHETDRDTAADRNFTPSSPQFVSGAVAPAMYVCPSTTQGSGKLKPKDQLLVFTTQQEKNLTNYLSNCHKVMELYKNWVQIGARFSKGF